MMPLHVGTAAGAVLAALPNIQAIQVVDPGTQEANIERAFTGEIRIRAAYSRLSSYSGWKADSFDPLALPFADIGTSLNERLGPLYALLGRTILSTRIGAETTQPSVAAAKRAAITELIQTRRITASVPPESAATADAAVRDALALVRRSELSGTPNVMLSDDGILTLQWQHGHSGVALIFGGDGVASIAFRRPGQYYAENGIDISVDGDFPKEFVDVLTQITA